MWSIGSSCGQELGFQFVWSFNYFKLSVNPRTSHVHLFGAIFLSFSVISQCMGINDRLLYTNNLWLLSFIFPVQWRLPPPPLWEYCVSYFHHEKIVLNRYVCSCVIVLLNISDLMMAGKVKVARKPILPIKMRVVRAHSLPQQVSELRVVYLQHTMQERTLLQDTRVLRYQIIIMTMTTITFIHR